MHPGRAHGTAACLCTGCPCGRPWVGALETWAGGKGTEADILLPIVELLHSTYLSLRCPGKAGPPPPADFSLYNKNVLGCQVSKSESCGVSHPLMRHIQTYLMQGIILGPTGIQ